MDNEALLATLLLLGFEDECEPGTGDLANRLIWKSTGMLDLSEWGANPRPARTIVVYIFTPGAPSKYGMLGTAHNHPVRTDDAHRIMAVVQHIMEEANEP